MAWDRQRRQSSPNLLEERVSEPDAAPAEAGDPLVISIDAGTSSIRALVFDCQGRHVVGFETHRPYAVTTTADGGVTADADMLVALVAGCIDDMVHVLATAGREAAAIACDTFWHSLIGVSQTGTALTPVLTWADTRSSETIARLRAHFDEPVVHARTGTELHSSYWPAKLLWLQDTQPHLIDQVAYWMSFGEYLFLRLFGERRVSLSMASGTGLFDQNECSWDAEVLGFLPIRQEQLSPLADYNDCLHDLMPVYRERWPSLHKIPWYLPIGDGACNNVGSGGSHEDVIVLMVGTSGAIRVVRVTDRIDIPDGLWTYRVDRRRFVQGGALSAGGNVFAWLLHTLRIPDVHLLENQLLTMRPDGHGLTVLPFLAGERSPNWNPRAQAVTVGGTLDTTPEDLVQANLEAIAYRFGAVYEIMQRSLPPVHSIIASGAGLIHSPAWMQIMADVLGQQLTASAVGEATGRGAALLVLEAMGVIGDAVAAQAPLAECYAPIPANVSTYRSAKTRQNKLYSRMME